MRPPAIVPPFQVQACTLTPPAGSVQVQVLTGGSRHDAVPGCAVTNTRPPGPACCLTVIGEMPGCDV